MKLYIHPASPNARKVAMAAAILGIPAETQVVDLMAGDQRKPAYLALNPNGMVPVLQDGDFTLSESNAIMQYLAGKKPGTTLWPADERARARVSQWMCWDLAHWSPTLGIFVWENMFKPLLGRGSTDPAALQQGEEKLKRFGGVLDDQLGRTAYVAGDALTLADLSICSFLMFARPGKIPVERFPNISRWFAKIEQLPAWKATQPPPI